MKFLTQLAIAGLMVSSAASAVAGIGAQGASDELMFASIDLHDIDLNSRVGLDALKRRLKDSVKQRCRSFSNHALGGVPGGPGNGRVVSAPVVETPRAQCVREGARSARLYREALVERAKNRD